MPCLSRRALNAFRHLSLCIFQHLRSIHVLPPGVAYIDGSGILIAGHQLNCVSQAAIAPAAAGLRPLEIVEDFNGTNEQAGINRIVVPQVFPDIGDPISAGLDFHRVFQIENGIEFSIYSDVEETRFRRIKQMIDHGIVEKMVAHREKKGFADVASGGKERDAILFLPVAVFDEGRAEAGRNQLLDLLDHAPAFVADHKVDAVIPARIRVSNAYEINGRPSTGTNGFKKVLSDPRRREPSPAIKMTASEIAVISGNTSSIPTTGGVAEEI